ncbi:hypothetical protein [Bartonella australis]|nr:hypothetical protein [Bartonella australis]
MWRIKGGAYKRLTIALTVFIVVARDRDFTMTRASQTKVMIRAV